MNLRKINNYLILRIKMYLLVCITFICAGQFRGLAQDTTYYNSVWEKTSPDKAEYFRKKVKTDTLVQVFDYFAQTGKLQMNGYYLDDSCKIQQGTFKWYDKNEKITHSQAYVHGKPDGNEILFYANGKKHMEGKNRNGERIGEWKGYYLSGKLSANVMFENGKQVSGQFFKEDGTLNKGITTFYREAAFPNGLPALYRFLNKTLKYPDSAYAYNIKGTVFVRFKISAEGKVSDIMITHPVQKYLDDEALRVIRMMPDWEPAITGGIYADDFKILPVIFNF